MAHAEHPLIAAHRSDTSPHLVGQGLKRQPVIGRGQSAGDGIAGAFALLHRKEGVNGFLEAPLQQVFVPVKGYEPPAIQPGDARDVKSVNRVKEE